MQDQIGQELPPQSALNDPRLFIPHPAQYKVVGRNGPVVTVKNQGSGKIVLLDQNTEVGKMALRDIERWRRIAADQRKKGTGVKMGLAIPPTDGVKPVGSEPSPQDASAFERSSPAPACPSPATPGIDSVASSPGLGPSPEVSPEVSDQ